MVGAHEASPPHCLDNREIKNRKWDKSMTSHSPPSGTHFSSQAPPPKGSVIFPNSTNNEVGGVGQGFEYGSL